MIVLVETIAFERDTNAAKYFRHWASAGFIRTDRQSLIVERLADLELVKTGLATVLVRRHGLGRIPRCWACNSVSVRRNGSTGLVGHAGGHG